MSDTASNWSLRKLHPTSAFYACVFFCWSNASTAGGVDGLA